MKNNEFNFIDIDDPVEAEERQINTRRLAEYGAEALRVGSQVESLYVTYSEFKAALAACDRIFSLSKILETPQGMIITGPPGSAKTSLAQYFIASLPPSDLFETGFGAIFLRLRVAPTQGHIISALLHALKYPFTQIRRGRTYAMRDISFEALRQRGTKVVFVDQGHCLATQARPRHSDVLESGASDTLREMMEETGVGLILLADASFGGLQHVDRALDDRITVRMDFSHFSDDNEWKGFLSAFVKGIPAIDLSILNVPDIATLTHTATNGNRRSFRRLIVETAMLATESKVSAVQVEHLRKAFDTVNGNAPGRSNPYAA
ncbi:TniB family NTP-binding protein [Ferribacterium limneticum]|uniref:TniB family NTP-binding protein n=1 Tax=Ferribacterium limneticum TaxID=76259 RepID=UPI001CFB12C7|nr:TniB family NTP-binding protein [Ferribacterium limneticum]UCV28143.1 TniB family NTP-binding protein [Ferribacterium limneticum]UCV32060.1 TniB family NTP-binding protein [Ferribacterium limneticum]